MVRKQLYRQRIYYPVGLISIILLPTFFIWYLNRNIAFENLRTLEIVWWSPNLHINNSFLFPKESHPERNYTEVNITGIDYEDKIELIKAQILIRELISSKSTSTGVHFHFEDESKYWTLIKVLDICKIEKATFYIPYENDIWVMNPAFENCVNNTGLKTTQDK